MATPLDDQVLGDQVLANAVLRIQSAFPRIYLACHTRHQTSRTTGEALSQRDGSILAHLDEQEPMPQALLTAHLGLAKSTLSEALKYLEKLGYIAREPDPTDPRGALVRRTTTGSAAMSRGSVLETSQLLAVLALLPADRVAKAVEGLELLARAAASLPKKGDL